MTNVTMRLLYVLLFCSAALAADDVEVTAESGARRLQATLPCEGAPEINYFDITVSVAELGSDCQEADKLFLGHALNQVLLQQGLGKSPNEAHALGLGGLCAIPEEVEIAGRSLRRLQGKFNYRGGWACGWFCWKDDRDRRSLATTESSRLLHNVVFEGSNEWFQTVYAPALEQIIHQAVLDTLSVDHQGCMGVNPQLTVQTIGVDLSTLHMQCLGGNVAETLGNAGEVTSRAAVSCDSCVSLDFSTEGSGHILKNGDLITGEEWTAAHGLSVSTTGGSATILNSSSTKYTTLGSPNSQCQGGGPGAGAGGLPGTPGENCNPVGNILTIRDTNGGVGAGVASVSFATPVLLSDIGLMSIVGQSDIIVTYADHTSKTITHQGYGENSVYRLMTNEQNVVKVDVALGASSGITGIRYCPYCDFSSCGTSVELTSLDETVGNIDVGKGVQAMDNHVGDDTWYIMYSATPVNKRFQTRSRASKNLVPVRLQSDPLQWVYDYGNTGQPKHHFPFEPQPGDILLAQYDFVNRNVITLDGVDMLVFKHGIQKGVNNTDLQFHLDMYNGKVNKMEMWVQGTYFKRKVKDLEDFEGATKVLDGWTKAKLMASEPEGFSKFLASDGVANSLTASVKTVVPTPCPTPGNQSTSPVPTDISISMSSWVPVPEKYYYVSKNADSVLFELDFYEIDNWEGNDMARIEIAKDFIDLGTFNSAINEGRREGTTPKGLQWVLTSQDRENNGFGDRTDQKHHVHIEVLRGSGLYDNGRLSLKLHSNVSGGGFAGWDNIRVIEKYDCL